MPRLFSRGIMSLIVDSPIVIGVQPAHHARNRNTVSMARLVDLAHAIVNITKKMLPLDVSTFADSITLLRYSDRVWKTLRKELYPQDYLEHPTIEKQAILVVYRTVTMSRQRSCRLLVLIRRGCMKLKQLYRYFWIPSALVGTTWKMYYL
jgi:hypothetical protein